MQNQSLNEWLITLSKRGIIAFPEESKEAFIERARSLLPLPQDQTISKLEKLYAISPDWVKLIYSNDSLRFWEGGCTWEEEERVVIQLRESFRRRETLYVIYKREEVLDHELVHAVRAPLHSTIFEELFAYQTSSNALRAFYRAHHSLS